MGDSTTTHHTTTSISDGLPWAFSCCLVDSCTHAQREARKHFRVSHCWTAAKKLLPMEKHLKHTSCSRDPDESATGAIVLSGVLCRKSISSRSPELLRQCRMSCF